MTHAQQIILIDGFILLLLTLAVLTGNFVYAIIPLLAAWLAIASAIISFIRPIGSLSLPLIYQAAYDTVFITLLLLGSYTLTAIAYLLVPIAIMFYFTQQPQENK